jgi:hypothetical protein
MEERLYDIEMIYMQNSRDMQYSIECISRFQKSTTLNFNNVEGVEINSREPLEIKSAYIQMSEQSPRVWNVRFSYPTHLRIKFTGRIIIEAV